MILYLDTSALVKLCVHEPGGEVVLQWVEDMPLASCRISWVEAHAALARRERETVSGDEVWAAARAQLALDWPRIHIVDVTQALVESAGQMAAAFALRGFDAVQLAAADLVRKTLPDPVKFVCFDRKLNRAAQLLGMQLPVGVPV